MRKSKLIRTDDAALLCKVKRCTIRQWVRRELLRPVVFARNGGDGDWNYYNMKDLTKIKFLRKEFGRNWVNQL